MSEELEREVLEVCNLSQGVRQEGIEIGEIRMLVQLVREGDLSLERAATKAKMTVEQFKKVMEDKFGLKKDSYMYYFISFERNLKKRLNEELRKQKQSATTIFAERRLLNYENME